MDPDCYWKGHIGRDGCRTDDVQVETVFREVETDVIGAIADAKGKVVAFWVVFYVEFRL
jgi:hypothetical protein